MKSNSAIFISFIISFGFFTYGCNNDDDNDQMNQASDEQYYSLLTFDEITEREFRMWTAGVEISTSGLNPTDFIDSGDYAMMSEAYFSSMNSLMFTEDSILNNDILGSETMAYYFSNDSLFIVANSVFGDIFFGTGDLHELTFTTGYMRFCRAYEDVIEIIDCDAQQRNADYDFEDALEEYDEIIDVSDISANDTLIIFNQKIIFSRQLII